MSFGFSCTHCCHGKDRVVVEWAKERLVAPCLPRLVLDFAVRFVATEAGLDDLTGRNYGLVKEYMIEFGGEPVPTAADHQDPRLHLHSS